MRGVRKSYHEKFNAKLLHSHFNKLLMSFKELYEHMKARNTAEFIRCLFKDFLDYFMQRFIVWNHCDVRGID